MYTHRSIFCNIGDIIPVSYTHLDVYKRQGEDWPMNSIAASVIGGVALTGGVGNPAGALIGAAVITIIQNIIVLFGVNSYWQSAVSGIVVVLAISFSSISTIVRENRQKRIKLN